MKQASRHHYQNCLCAFGAPLRSKTVCPPILVALASELPLRIRTFQPRHIPGGLRDLVEVGRHVFRLICTVRSSLLRRGAARFSQQRASHVCAKWLLSPIRPEARQTIQRRASLGRRSKTSKTSKPGPFDCELVKNRVVVRSHLRSLLKFYCFLLCHTQSSC